MVVFAVAVLTLPLLAWSAVALMSDDDSGTPSTSNTDSDTTARASAAETADSYARAHAVRMAIRSCAANAANGLEVVAEARTGVAHWAAHIQARTDMLEGRASQEQMRATWKRTRLAGPGDLARFAEVLDAYELSECDDPGVEDAPPNLRDDLDSCLRHATDVEAAVSAAIAAIADWEHHLHDMAAHADGAMDAEMAQEKWVETWKNAPTNINGFRDARDALEKTPECRGAIN